MDEELGIKITADAAGVQPGVDKAKDGVTGLGQTVNQVSQSVASTSSQMVNSLKSVFAGLNAIFGGAAQAASAGAAGIGSFHEASEAAVGGVNGLKGAINGMGAVVEGALAPLLAFTAILGGGKFFKEAIADTAAFYKEAAVLGRQMGTSANEAAQLGIAIKGVGGSTETFGEAATMLTRQIRANEDAVKKMGLATRDADGNYRDTKTLMMDAISVLNQYKEGTDRNLAAQVLFGRGAANLGPILRLNNDMLEEAKEKQEALGLVITKEGQEKVAAYRTAMIEVKEVLEGLSVTIGSAVMPLFTQMAQWFADVGPAVVTVFRKVMDVLAFAIQSVIDVVKLLWEATSSVFQTIASLAQDYIGTNAVSAFLTWDNVIKVVKITLLSIKEAIEDVIMGVRIFVEVTVSLFQTWHNTVNALLRLDFSGAASAVEQGMHQIEDKVRASVQRMGQIWKENQITAGKIWDGSDKEHPADEAPHKGFKSYESPKEKKEKKDKEGNLVQEWQTELADLLTQEQNWGADATKVALNFWQEKLKLTQSGSKDELEVQREVAKAKLAAFKEEQAASIAMIKERTEIAIDLAKTEVAITKTTLNEKLDAIAAEESAGHLSATRAAQQRADLNRQIRALDVQLENEDYAAKLKAFNDEMALAHTSEAKRADLMRQTEVLVAAHQNRLRVLAATNEQQGLQDLQKVEAAKRAVFDKTFQGFSSNIAKMVSLQQGFFTTLRGFLSSFQNMFETMVQRMVQNWLVGIAMKEAASKTSHAREIMMDAKSAAAGAYKAMAGIPYVGPVLAPIAAAAAFAGVMAFSAKGGMGDVPYDDAPFLLHKNEMVLPADIATSVRAMAKAGGGAGGAQSTFTPPAPANSNPVGGDTHIHIHAMDSRSFAAYAKDNAHHIAGAVDAAYRGGYRSKYR